MKNKRKWSKGELSRTIVVFSIRTMTATLAWAVILKTLSVIFGWCADLTDVLTFAGCFFGGELTLLAFKRIFAKNRKEDDDETEQQSI